MTATLSVLEYHLTGYRRTWRGSVTPVLAPAMQESGGFDVD